MTRKISFLFIAITSILTGISAQTSQSKWQPDPINIDGIADDWGNTIRFYNSDSKINYEFRNDDKDLYVILKSKEQSMQRQIMIAGFKIRFKVKSDPTVIATITYPGLDKKAMPAEMEEGPNSQRKSMKMPPSGNNEQMDDQMPPTQDKLQSEQRGPVRIDTITTDGFLFAPQKISSLDVKTGQISFAKTKFDRAKEMVYEFRIPIRELAGNNYILDKLSDTKIQMQITIEAPAAKSSGGGGNSHIGMHGGGMGGGMGGGPGGGMGGGPGGGMGGGPGGDMNGGDMGGGDMGGGDMGSAPDGEMKANSMTRKTINAQFYLTTQKPQN